MGGRQSGERQAGCPAPSDFPLPGNALDFFHQDHLRKREVCARIARLSELEAPDADEICDIMSFLTHELPPHLADEEQDLFPLLARRCRPEDEIEPVIARLAADHRRIRDRIPGILAVLKAAGPGGKAFSDEHRARLHRFSADLLQHLILEYAIVLPFARLRLNRRDMGLLQKGMLRRRGLDRLLEACDAG